MFVALWLILVAILLTGPGPTAAQSASDRMSYPKALTGRFDARQDLPAWLRVPRWCTRDSPFWKQGETGALIDGFADRHADCVRLGTFWGGVARFPSNFAPCSPSLIEGVDPLNEAVKTVRRRGMHLLAYLNPNAYREENPLYAMACVMGENGAPSESRPYGRPGRFACFNHPAFAEFYQKAIREVVGRYGADGIYVDGLTPHLCYCPYCREKYKKDTGRELPTGLGKLSQRTCFWEMTSDWDWVGDVENPDQAIYSRWLMKCLTEATQRFTEAARAARPGAVAVYHTWPKPDTLPYYDATLNEIYAKKPWNFTLWKQAEFANWGDVFEIPSLVNVYLRQEPWGKEKRNIRSEVEARHKYWQALANGGYPNAWDYPGMELPFEVMRTHADLFDFSTTVPTKFLALPRPMFEDARHEKIRHQDLIPLVPGNSARLRIVERDPNGKIDLVCLRADGESPNDGEYRDAAQGKARPNVIYLKASAFDPARSVTEAEGRSWTVVPDPQALSGAYLTSTGHASKDPKMWLEYRLPPISSAGPWMLWARVIFRNAGSDSFYWQVSNDDGQTWTPGTPRDECALGWEQPQKYTWVQARVVQSSEGPDSGPQVDRFLSPAAGMYAGLLHAGLPIKEMHPNHINRQSLEGYRVLVLANELCLSDEQCAMIRDRVGQGMALVATHETSLYDLSGKRRSDFGLADVFGVNLRGRVTARNGQMIRPEKGVAASWVPADGLPNREDHLLVAPQDAQVVARLTGPGVPDPGVPAVLTHQFGKGRVVYLPGRLDSSYSLWGDAGFRGLIRTATDWACQGDVPAGVVRADGLVGVTCFDQPGAGRRLIHLVSYQADWVSSYDRLPTLTNVQLQVHSPEGKRIASARAVLSNGTLTVSEHQGVAILTLPQLAEYEIVELKWQ